MSAQYRLLVRRLDSLAKRFVSQTVINHPFTSASQDKLVTFRLLLHAEIEYVIEQIIAAKAKRAQRDFISRKIVSPILLSLVVFSETRVANVPRTLTGMNPQNDFNFRYHRAINHFIRYVETKNHGIKEEDILSMIIPLGVDYSLISQTLLNTLSSFGGQRGEVAHKSFKVINPIDPTTELTVCRRLVSELHDLDEIVENLT